MSKNSTTLKINPHTVLKDLRGKPLKDGDPSKDDTPNLTLGDMIAGALGSTPSKQEGQAKQADLVKRFKLAMRFIDVPSGQHVEVSPEDMVLVKECVAAFPYLPIATGQALAMLGGD